MLYIPYHGARRRCEQARCADYRIAHNTLPEDAEFESSERLESDPTPAFLVCSPPLSPWSSATDPPSSAGWRCVNAMVQQPSASSDSASHGSLHAAHQKLRKFSDIAEGHIRFRTLVAQLEHPQQGNPKTQQKATFNAPHNAPSFERPCNPPRQGVPSTEAARLPILNPRSALAHGTPTAHRPVSVYG